MANNKGDLAVEEYKKMLDNANEELKKKRKPCDGKDMEENILTVLNVGPEKGNFVVVYDSEGIENGLSNETIKIAAEEERENLSDDGIEEGLEPIEEIDDGIDL